MTDLERHVNAKGRDELVKQVRRKIKELGIEYIYYQFVSVTGRIVGKGVPADHWETVNAKWDLEATQKVAALAAEKRAGWRQAAQVGPLAAP